MKTAARNLALLFVMAMSAAAFAQTPCDCVQPPSGMALWLPFDETSPLSPARNALGSEGARSGGTIAPGVVVRSTCMNGLNGYVTVTNYPAINSDSLTIDAWLARPVASTASNVVSTIVDKRTIQNLFTQVRGYSFYLLGDNLGAQLATGGAPVNSITPANVKVPPDGIFHHVALTIERGTPTGGKFYLDGQQVHVFSTTTPTGGGLNSLSPLRVGANSQTPANNVFRGCIDEVEVFRRALDPTEIKAIYAAGRRGKCRFFGQPSFGEMCNLQTIVQHHQLCNTGTTLQQYTYSLAALAPLGACTVQGPPTFNPPGGTILVPPGQCVDVPVTIGRPPFASSFGVACYQMTVIGPSGSIQLPGTVSNGCPGQ